MDYIDCHGEAFTPTASCEHHNVTDYRCGDDVEWICEECGSEFIPRTLSQEYTAYAFFIGAAISFAACLILIVVVMLARLI